jgi:hypothetical protein
MVYYLSTIPFSRGVKKISNSRYESMLDLLKLADNINCNWVGELDLIKRLENYYFKKELKNLNRENKLRLLDKNLLLNYGNYRTTKCF